MGFLDKMLSPEAGMRLFLNIFGDPAEHDKLRAALATVELTPEENAQLVSVLEVSLEHFKERNFEQVV